MAIYLNNKLIGMNSHTIVEHNTNTTTTIEPLTITQNGYYTAPSGKAYTPITVNAAPTLNLIILRPDAELIQSYSRDYKMIANDNISLPAYSTSNQVLQATKNLSPTISLDYTNYDYYILQRGLLIPEYNTNTLGKGRVEYEFFSSLAEVVDLPANTYKSIDGSKTYTGRHAPVILQNNYCNVYWSSATAIAPYSSSTYGIIPIPTAPSISSGVLTARAPSVNVRGHATYMAQDYYEALTDIRLQYVIEVYRAPKNNLNIDGWGNYQQTMKILNCINNNNCHLV